PRHRGFALFRNRSNTDSSEQTIAWGRARIKSMEATLAAIGEKGLSEKRARLPRKAEAMGDPSILLNTVRAGERSSILRRAAPRRTDACAAADILRRQSS